MSADARKESRCQHRVTYGKSRVVTRQEKSRARNAGGNLFQRSWLQSRARRHTPKKPAGLKELQAPLPQAEAQPKNGHSPVGEAKRARSATVGTLFQALTVGYLSERRVSERLPWEGRGSPCGFTSVHLTGLVFTSEGGVFALGAVVCNCLPPGRECLGFKEYTPLSGGRSSGVAGHAVRVRPVGWGFGYGAVLGTGNLLGEYRSGVIIVCCVGSCVQFLSGYTRMVV